MRILVFLAFVSLTLEVKHVSADPNELPVLGAVLELSGTNAHNGEGCREGFEVGVNYFNRNPSFAPLIADHRGEAKTGIAEFKKLVTINAAAAVIVQRSQIGMAVNPISRELKIAMIGIVGHPKMLSDNPFALRSYPSTETEGSVLAKEAVRRGIRRVASITLEDEWTLALDESFFKSFVDQGGKDVGRFRFLADEYDPSPIIPKLKAASPDAIFVNMNIPLSGATVRKLREKGIRSPLLGNFWAATPEAVKAAGSGNAAGLLYPAVNLDKPIFRQFFSKTFPGSQPIAVSYTCFAAAAAFSQLVGNAPVSRESIIERLPRMSELLLPDERLKIKEREIVFDVRTYEVGDNG